MRRSLLLCCLLLLFTAACEKSEVYSDLSQADANEMLVLLTRSGIEVEMTRDKRQNQTFYGIAVAPSDLDRARALLSEHNLPRTKRPGLADVFAEPGFIPTPQEQKARFLMALKGEIINALEGIPDVVESNVILNMPSPEEFGSEAKQAKPTASVVIKVRPTEEAVATLTEAKVQRFVANSVEKLDPRDVSVIITYTEPPKGGVMPGQSLILPSAKPETTDQAAAEAPTDTGDTVTVAGLAVGTESAGRLKLYLGLFLGLLALLSLALIVMVIQASRMRQEMQAGGVPALPGEVLGEDEPPRLGAGEE